MSELRSLFIKLKVKQENLDRFFENELIAPQLDEQWLSWWDSREMYGKSALSKIPIYTSYDDNREVVDSHLDSLETGSIEVLDADQGAWTFASLLFSQNYEEILPIMAWFKSLASYLDAGEEGELLIFDFFWGSDQVMAHMVLDGQQVEIKHTKSTKKVDKKFMAEATKAMQDALADMQRNHKDLD